MKKTHPSTSIDKDSSWEAGAGRRRLGEAEISKIVQTLSPFWIQGHRNNLELALVGWLWKTRVDYELRRQWKFFETGVKKEDEILGKAGIEAELESILAEKYLELSPEERAKEYSRYSTSLNRCLAGGERRTYVHLSAPAYLLIMILKQVLG